ncbi:MAG: glycoside hydrolase family 32 protein [Saprospiraceae bacterium]|nr:glycoside hydrolase family 32 protein [Saprospiraceae bacterium]
MSKFKIHHFIILIAILLIQNSCRDKDITNYGCEFKDSAFSLEEHRPQYHFTPESNWMNDPNGMVYHNGEYHLFYQYYPDSTVWGPMHWGHAVSKNLIQWEHLPVALYPDSLGWIFSGSAVIDKGNTSGLGKEGNDPMIAIFTHHNARLEKSGSDDFQYQSLAYSNDNGRTFTMYKGNPVIENPGVKDFRDPKVFKFKGDNEWKMVLAAYDKAYFYTSPNLLDWTKTGEFGIPGDDRLWECPDLIEIAIEGTNEKKWALIVSIQQKGPNGGTATSYFIGDYDGKTFKANYKNQKWLDFGKDNYAFVTWAGVPDDRVLGIGWMSNWQYAQQVPTEKWRSAMTLPRELKLLQNDGDLILSSLPVKEVSVIHETLTPVNAKKIENTEIIAENLTLAKLEFTLKKPKNEPIVLRLSNSKNEYLDVGYDPIIKSYYIDRTNAGNSAFSSDFTGKHIGQANYNHETIEMLIYLDQASIELFSDNGQCVITEIFFPSEPFHRFEILGNGETEIIKGGITSLRSIW